VAPYERPRLGPTLRRSHDDLGVIELTKGVHVASVPRRECGKQDLHVLLRHRLLRQPGGFKGFLVVPEVFEHDDLPAAERMDLAEHYFVLDAAPLPSQTSAGPCHDLTTGVDQLLADVLPGSQGGQEVLK